MISKDTAYIDENGAIHNETINRPLTGPWDFLNTYIVNIYPDTTCWVNDFRNSDNEIYLRNYFSNPTYNNYPVVGVRGSRPMPSVLGEQNTCLKDSVKRLGTYSVIAFLQRLNGSMRLEERTKTNSLGTIKT